MQALTNLLALDVGNRRIGVARANGLARLASPLMTLVHDETIWHRLQEIVDEYDIKLIVIGLPRGLSGQETAQTASTRSFAKILQDRLQLPIHFQDEALTSHQAQTELARLNKHSDKEAVDALAATYILEDFLNQSQRAGVKHG